MRLIHMRRRKTFPPHHTLEKLQAILMAWRKTKLVLYCAGEKSSVGNFATAQTENQFFLLPTSVFPTTSLALGCWALSATNSWSVVGWIHITRSPLKHSCLRGLLFWVCGKKTRLKLDCKMLLPSQEFLPLPSLLPIYLTDWFSRVPMHPLANSPFPSLHLMLTKKRHF